MDSVLLKDYQPDLQLVLPETRMSKASSVIDVHSHDFMSNIKTGARRSRLGEDDGHRRDRDLGGLYRGHGAGVRKPGEIDSWPTRALSSVVRLDTKDFDKPGYSQRAAAEVERASAGAPVAWAKFPDKGLGIPEGEAAAE